MSLYYSVAKKANGLLLFLKAFSWETDLWVTLGELTVKNAKFGREIFIKCTGNRLDRNEIWYAEDTLYKIAPNFTYSHKSWFFKYNWNFLDQLLLPYKFYGIGMWGVLFFIFASCEPLKMRVPIGLYSRKRNNYSPGISLTT